MDILKLATEWARAEVFSAKFFILFGFMFVAATIGFWQLGKTDMAKAFIWPTLVGGAFLLAVGFGIFFTNKARAASFPTAYAQDASAFVKAEIARTEQTMGEYKLFIYKLFPVIMIVSALLLLFVEAPLWRGISITMVALLGVICMIDSNANARIVEYNKHLVAVDIS